MTAFRLNRSWQSRKSSSELEATFCQLSITIDGKNVSEFVDQRRARHEELEIPAYFLAEWIADNWWPLLWEPRKSEDAPENPDFVARHSILAAQHGFALPRVQFIPTGKSILVSAKPRAAQLAEVHFPNAATASPLREEVERELRKFVDATVQRLDNVSLSGTGLQEAWALVNEISEEEVPFCQFAGALGLTPDEVDDHIAASLEKFLPILGERLLMDLCLVSRPDNFEIVAQTAETVHADLRTAPIANIEPLLSVPVPADNFNVQAWHRGKRAAVLLRNKFGLSETDPHGAARVFERLNIDPTSGSNVVSTEPPLSGVIARSKTDARIGLLQTISVQRRFAAARGIFAAWTADANESRFLTSAVTRDQQANRAFAAELTAPIAFLRKNAKRSKLKQDQVFDLAAELQIGADVVSKQALNNGLQVVPM
jgi:DNA-binding transcriptional ArsR family regulator